MLKIRKILILSIIALFLVAFNSVNHAKADTTPPEINANSLKVSNKNVCAGHKIHLEIEIKDDSGVKSAIILYKIPGVINYRTVYLKYNEKNGLFETDIEITENWKSGIYKIYEIDVSDNNNNFTSYYNNNIETDGGEDCLDLSNGDFTVYDSEEEINPNDPISDKTPSVSYKTHVEDVGWQDWKNDGEISGTEGKGLRLEGIRIELENSEKYSIAYRVHVQDIGWQEWKYDGEMAGTEGLGLRLEAIEIKIFVKEIFADNKMHITYQTHIQNVGWQEYKKDGETSGTSGLALRLEALKIKGINLPKGVKIKYQTHIQNVGWQGWRYDGEISGTEGQGLRLEGIRIELENTEEYSIAYRAHVQYLGWQDWCYDGEISGTEGQGLRLEAIEIKILPKIERAQLNIESEIKDTYYKNELIEITGWKMATVMNTKLKVLIDEKDIGEEKIKAIERTDILNSVYGYGTVIENPMPGFKFTIDTNTLNDGNHKLEIWVINSKGKILDKYTKNIKKDNQIHIIYKSHVENVGWQDWRYDGEMAGTEGQGLRLEGIYINKINLPDGINIKYQTHVQNIGWQDWCYNGEMAGTEGQGLRLEGIKIKLENTEKYSVSYRCHVQYIGWQDWCYDGEISGTENEALRLEAIEIKIVPKIQQTKTKLYLNKTKYRISNENHKIDGWVMASMENVSLKILIDNKELSQDDIIRTKRQDVLNRIKGYGEYNENPGYEISVDFSQYSIGKHLIKVQAITNNNILAEETEEIEVRNKITCYKGTYGVTGYKVKGDYRGRDLEYYRFGNGPNVFFATFAIHGYEDKWGADSWELIACANELYNTLVANEDYDISDKWTIYIFPGVNWDGINHGYTNNGPGRTTCTSIVEKGIDLNRCWSSNFNACYNDRNYTGSEPFLAYEARYLRDFMINHKAQNGQTVLVDLHGWTQQLIGNSEVCSYYAKQFPENDGSAIERYGTGYMIGWARTTLGAKASLIELPDYAINNHQDVMNNNLYGRYVEATLDMLRNM